jgi:hypothetical protein
MRGKRIEEQAGNEKPPAALAGGGLGCAALLIAIDQASFPARGLWLLIRIAGMHAVFRANEQQVAMATGFCMTMKQVEQSGAGRVKRMSCVKKTDDRGNCVSRSLDVGPINHNGCPPSLGVGLISQNGCPRSLALGDRGKHKQVMLRSSAASGGHCDGRGCACAARLPDRMRR